MILYILKASFCLGLLLSVYHLFLEKEKMHQFNRFYLLGSIMFSFLAPLFVIYTNPTTVAESFTDLQLFTDTTIQENSFNYSYYLYILYAIISFVLFIRFAKNVFVLIHKIKSNTKTTYKNATLVLLAEKLIPHTFLSYIFINKNEFQTNSLEKELFEHELTHVREKHTIDIFIVELLQIICWFNPLIIYLKRAIKLNHEFIADSNVIQSYNNTTEYQYLLLSKISQNQHSYLASNFNYLLTKKRLIMMTKQSSQLKMLFKKIAIIPLAVALLFLFANRVEAKDVKVKSTIVSEITPQEKVTPEMIAEYNALAKKFNSNSNHIYKVSEVKRFKYIYSLMSEKQKKAAEAFPKFSPPPPPPPAKKVSKQLRIIEDVPPPPPPARRTSKKTGVKPPPPPAPVKIKVKKIKEVKNIPPPPPPKKEVKKQINTNLSHKVQNKSIGNIKKPYIDSNGDKILVGHRIPNSSISEKDERHPTVLNYTDYAQKFVNLETPNNLDFKKIKKLYNVIPLSKKTSLMTPGYILNNKEFLKETTKGYKIKK